MFKIFVEFLFCSRLWNCTKPQIEAVYDSFGVVLEDDIFWDVAELILGDDDLEYILRRVNTENFQWSRIMRVTGQSRPSEFK